jgi:membrane protein
MQQPEQDPDSPIDIPARGWWEITRRAVKASQADDVPMLAAGVAFFAFLSLFPTMIAALTLFGLIADPHQVAQQMQSVFGALPTGAR